MSIRRQSALGTRRLLTLAVALPIAVLLIAVSILAAHPGPAGAATVTIPMGGSDIYGFWFCDASHSGNVCTTTIQVGDTVTWRNDTGYDHTSTECDGNCGAVLPPTPLPLWDSGPVAPNGTFPRQFNQIGTFNYQCNIHPTQMKGQIVVTAAKTLTPTRTPTSTPPPTSTATPAPAVGGISLDPGVHSQPIDTHSSSVPGGSVLPGAAAGAIALGGAAWWLRKRAIARR